jgi:galactose mutarotase-like enzyme
VIELASDELAVALRPERGGEVASVVHRASGVDILFRTPWADAVPGTAWDSQSAWHAGYRGGWQLLCPNAGTESEAYGGRWGFHGEAAIVPWRVLERDARSARLATALFTAPLELERTVTVSGTTVRLDERVTNLSPEPLELMLVQHPAFGPPLVAPGCRIETSAARFQADAGGAAGAWPVVDGVDLSLVPPGERFVFGYLSGFAEGAARLTNDGLGLSAELRWPLERFPFAWLWQELHASSGFPWFRRAYVVAVEPASTIPQGFAAARAAGSPLVSVASGETCAAWTELSVKG